MFTNWLTGTTGLTNSSNSSNNTSSTSRLTDTNNLTNSSTTSIPSNSLSLLNTHNSINSINSSIMSSPPDIILEVGPSPSTVRFMAHGLVLGMHSGYLRSAIRLDERSSSTNSTSSVPDIIVYLSNVTAEQFAPLLTYMYTGYLDLNVENIFGVLLATHVLHMPRALEICRSYLARAQTEGYFGPNNPALTANNHPPLTSLPPQSNKIIRPIASKPQLPNFGFIPLNHGPLGLNPLPNPSTVINSSSTISTENKSQTPLLEDTHKDEDDDIEVDEIDKQSLNNENHQPNTIDEDDEDIEVFIDSNSEAEVVVETQIQKLSFKKLMESKKSSNEKDSSKERQKHHDKSSNHRKHSQHSKSERRRKGGSSGLQVAKAPIPASQLDTSEANKVIIDVASCDGPVRFKRILNTAYGHKPDSSGPGNNHIGFPSSGIIPERSLQSVSLSFHQQMAKTISQQQQLHQAEESENSETSNGSLGHNSARTSEKTSGSRKIQSEVFVCVYCKHTFKSQYCYQKHAKRHLNPLTLQATCVPEGKMLPSSSSNSSNNKEESSSTTNGELQITKHQNINAARPFYNRNTSTHYLNSNPNVSTALPSANASSSSTDYLRREVRPLDMNVQYYPCKTCGCKFPSYYFVHKHRKMCHAEEEAQQSNSANGASDSTNAAAILPGSSGTPMNTTVASEECLNSQNSD